MCASDSNDINNALSDLYINFALMNKYIDLQEFKLNPLKNNNLYLDFSFNSYISNNYILSAQRINAILEDSWVFSTVSMNDTFYKTDLYYSYLSNP